MNKLPVIIVENSYGLTAVFPTLPWSTPDTMTCFDLIGGHGAGTKEWYKETKKAKDSENKANLLRTLRNIYSDIELQECKRWTTQFDFQRLKEYNKVS